VKTLAALVVASVALAGCGADQQPAAEPAPPPAAVDECPPGDPGGTADACPTGGGPDDPPPTLGMAGPPPAWAETPDGPRWLAFSTYCWENVCADYVAPRCGDARIPDVPVERGEEIRFHLEFDAQNVSLTLVDQGRTVTGLTAPSPRVWTWAADADGAVTLHTTAAQGQDASYAACVRLSGGGGGGAAPAPGGALSVEQALTSGTREPILIRGSLLIEGGVTRLCSGFAESHPPQCMEPSLVLEGLVFAQMEGLLRREGDVQWSDEPFQVLGTLEGRRLTVLSTAQ
jgi:hypothetical protein